MDRPSEPLRYLETNTDDLKLFVNNPQQAIREPAKQLKAHGKPLVKE